MRPYGHVPAWPVSYPGLSRVVAIVSSGLKIGGRALKGCAHVANRRRGLVAIYFLQVPFPLIVLLAGVVGLVGVWLWPQAFVTPDASANKNRRWEGCAPQPFHRYARD